MTRKEEFKEFVRKNPSLIKYVKNGEMNWQKFYEIYDIYGEDESAWKEYLKKKERLESVSTATKTLSISDFLGFLKTIDLDSLQETVGSLQRVLGLFGDLTNKNIETPKQEYKPRPLYKHFDD